jgi:DNA-binding transcriptional regulator YhcF (GntR family)
VFGKSKTNFAFTDSVRHALAAAKEEAHQLQHDYVGTEHIMLGLTHGESGRGLMAALRVDPENLRESCLQIVRRGHRAVPFLGELPYTSRAKKVMEFSMTEARARGDDYVGLGHVLLGLLLEQDGIAARILNQHSVTVQSARRVVFSYTPLHAAPEPTSRFRIQVDDRADVSIYEQIVAQVQEGVATGTLRAGERLPTVRHLADELDIAPGTVARAYGELEQRGVVVTEGARGTRVADRQQRGVPAGARPETLVGLLRPVAVAAFHLGASAGELRQALERAMTGIFEEEHPAP